jgi:ABC-type transport system substrate-binding protein
VDDASADRAAQVIGRRRFLAIGAGVAATAIPRRAPARPPTCGGVLKHIGLEPSTFDVHATAAHQTQLVSSFVRRSLFKLVNGARYGPSDFTIVPDLALRATVSSDGKAYTIALRPEVRWESRPPVNGREMVASDVKYSLERVLRKSPFAPLLGPVEAVFARNPTYHAPGLPLLDKVEWLFLKDRSTQLSLFRAGQVDVPFYDARIPGPRSARSRRRTPSTRSRTGTGWRCGRSRCEPTGLRSATFGFGARSAWGWTGATGCGSTWKGRGTWIRGRCPARCGSGSCARAT